LSPDDSTPHAAPLDAPAERLAASEHLRFDPKAAGRRIEPAPGIWQALGLSLLFYMVFGLVALPLMMVETLLAPPIRFLIQGWVAWSSVLVLAKDLGRGSWSEVFPVTRFSPRLIPGIVLASVGLLVFASTIAEWIPTPASWNDLVAELFEVRYQWAHIANQVVLAPVAEELFFRGFVLRGFLARYSVRKAVIASTVLFALLHLNPWQGVMALPLGALFAWLFLRTGSLGPCILGHACANGLYLVILGSYELAGNDVETLAAEESSGGPWGLVIGASLATIGFLLLKQQFLSKPWASARLQSTSSGAAGKSS